ncbi:MAG TPA: CDP-diacylglycerol--glycerol-3-phosphate 3-phosphatidyltransferase [Firmicutes bacterium]|nr:CDP-diacylglycerol--glycerol-3-phosphate 3-phosphatidyltransferase [Bacillota bacterium]
MNLPNRITISRIIISILVLIMMIFPFYQLGIEWPTYLVGGRIEVNLKYIICGIFFIIASATDFLDGYLARKNGQVTDFGKVMDAIADKILVNGILIVLAVDGFIPVAIPVIIITRDTFVDSIKMVAGQSGKAVGASLMGKLKTICMMTGVSFMLIYNLPFELIGIKVADTLIIIATVLSVVSGVQYYQNNKAALTKQI